MLRNMVARTVWASQAHARRTGFREMATNPLPVDIASKLNLARVFEQSRRPFHMSLTKFESIDRKNMLASMPKQDWGTEGEQTVDIDSGGVKGFDRMFPDENTPGLLFDGVRFDALPILHIQISKNNTIMALTDAEGKFILTHSCGLEGYKNSRKSTGVAAQATGITLATRAVDRGFRNVRVKVKGLGPGRMSGVKGVTMGGLNVVCIADVTWINWDNSPRPRKARKL